jgi:Protein of unknown function (DUF2442)
MYTPRITAVTPLIDYRLQVDFANGEHRMFDCKPYFAKGVFQELQNPVAFAQVKAHKHFIEWPNEIDLSADTLYLRGIA